MEEINVKNYSKINLYEVLDITDKSDKKTIKKKFNKLVLKYHPDKKGGDIDKYQAITIAYKILSNDDLREKYDSEYKKILNNKKTFNDLKTEFIDFKVDDEKNKLTAAKEYDDKNIFLNEKHGLNKNAVKSMADIGIDISHHNSNLIDEYKDEKFDFIITVCDNANETCPVLPNSSGKKIHKNFTDPSKLNNGLYNKEFEEVRGQIKSFIINFINEELI